MLIFYMRLVEGQILTFYFTSFDDLIYNQVQVDVRILLFDMEGSSILYYYNLSFILSRNIGYFLKYLCNLSSLTNHQDDYNFLPLDLRDGWPENLILLFILWTFGLRTPNEI